MEWHGDSGMAQGPSTKQEDVIRNKLVEFAEEMRPLDAEFAEVLRDNLWDLYIQSSDSKDNS